MDSIKPKVYNKYHRDAPPNAVNIMRPSKWGNIFRIGASNGRGGILTRADVIALHRIWLHGSPQGQRLLTDIEELAPGVVCCCAPLACHGDNLIEAYNEHMKAKGS